ncbi:MULTISPECIES: glycosyltransferase [unclassified Vibrio]|uniref:glycosyltransferase n=1 Tax=Vibrio TaxID=662 RepID=UPI0020A566A6|nr:MULTISPECIES: glycosyltransferase [unclassified Vibrio]
MKKIVKNKISVLTLTYNHECYIKECLDSILNASKQCNLNVQIIVSDDASKDDTLKIIDEFSRTSDVDIKKLSRERNVGVAQNFLSAIEYCDGEYIIFLDGDDKVMKDKITKSLRMFEMDLNTNLVHHNVNEINENSQITREKKFKNGVSGDVNALYYNCQENIQSCAVMVRNREGIKWEDIIDINNNLVDLPFIIAFSDVGKISYIDEVLSSYRVLSSSIMRTTNIIKHEANTRQYLIKLSQNESKWARNTAISASFIREALVYKMQGKTKLFIFTLVKSILLLPRLNNVIARYYYRVYLSLVKDVINIKKSRSK